VKFDSGEIRTIVKLDGITTFVAVAEAGSNSEAARRLRLSTSVVSDRLTELERNLGASLVHRSMRNLTLTKDGLAFLERASRIEQKIEEAPADLAQRRGALVGPIAHLRTNRSPRGLMT
jgi:DNA-binding transcriptional LysR family regulator